MESIRHNSSRLAELIGIPSSPHAGWATFRALRASSEHGKRTCRYPPQAVAAETNHVCHDHCAVGHPANCESVFAAARRLARRPLYREIACSLARVQQRLLEQIRSIDPRLEPCAEMESRKQIEIRPKLINRSTVISDAVTSHFYSTY